jgi:hypothetical protein
VLARPSFKRDHMCFSTFTDNVMKTIIQHLHVSTRLCVPRRLLLYFERAMPKDLVRPSHTPVSCCESSFGRIWFYFPTFATSISHRAQEHFPQLQSWRRHLSALPRDVWVQGPPTPTSLTSSCSYFCSSFLLSNHTRMAAKNCTWKGNMTVQIPRREGWRCWTRPRISTYFIWVSQKSVKGPPK